MTELLPFTFKTCENNASVLDYVRALVPFVIAHFKNFTTF